MHGHIYIFHIPQWNHASYFLLHIYDIFLISTCKVFLTWLVLEFTFVLSNETEYVSLTYICIFIILYVWILITTKQMNQAIINEEHQISFRDTLSQVYELNKNDRRGARKPTIRTENPSNRYTPRTKPFE